MYKFKKYFLLIASVALFGEIYFYPFNTSLRISAGIIALNLVILILDDVSVYTASILSGITIFLLRSIMGTLLAYSSIAEVVQYNFPSGIYYFIYGFFVFTLGIRKYREKFVTAIFLLAAADSISNIVEALIRDKTITLPMIQVFILVGLARSTIAYFVYLLYKKQELFVLSREHQKRYSQLNILISDIQAEMFYLKKSMGDIEKVMSKSYKLYETYKENRELQEDTLEIAREVHEIKKDYYRVLSGFDGFLKNFEKQGAMSLSDMVDIIQENTHRYLTEREKHVSIQFRFSDDFPLKKYYNLFTILNNLIINAIDANASGGMIDVSEYSDQDNIFFRVSDRGEGICEDILPYIFNPGFTTKYDENTGKPSTGIGLSHVKNIVDELQGNISAASDAETGTTFRIAIPKKSLME
ncbi:MAG: sensor histidine kinase [Bacillota bacterium]